MRIVCSKCNTEYDIELPRTAVEGKHRSLKFRCSSCGYIFTTHLDQAEKKASPPEEPVADKAVSRPVKAQTPAKGMLLKQEGKTYNVRDLATLQRWIIERRVLSEDDVTLESLGKVLGISKERVRQIEARALEKLRGTLSDLAA